MLTFDDEQRIARMIENKFPELLNPANFPSGLIRSRHIKDLKWDKGVGGTLALGGAADVSGLLLLKDADGTIIVTMDKDGIAVVGTGDITVGGDSINTNAEVFSQLSIEHFWTASSSYTDRTGCRFALNGDNFDNQNVYFECVMANEQASRTAYTQIYNITDSAVLASSEITTTVNPLSALTRVRSSALTIPSGLKEYKLQIKMNQAGGAGDNAHFYASRLVITQS